MNINKFFVNGAIKRNIYLRSIHMKMNAHLKGLCVIFAKNNFTFNNFKVIRKKFVIEPFSKIQRKKELL